MLKARQIVLGPAPPGVQDIAAFCVQVSHLVHRSFCLPSMLPTGSSDEVKQLVVISSYLLPAVMDWDTLRRCTDSAKIQDVSTRRVAPQLSQQNARHSR